MALPTSGPLSLANIQTEFGGSNPISLSEYYAGGAYVPSGTTGTYGAVPSSGAISLRNFYGTSKFTPVTRTYTTGTGATDTVPTGATSVTIRVVGGGGSGAKDSVNGAGGGGSGGYALRTIAVSGGQTFTYTVGQGGAGVSVDQTNGNSGGDSTVTGTVTGGSVSMTGGGGERGYTGLVPGAGGTASGGSTNTPGNAGSGGNAGASVYSGYGNGTAGRQLATGSSNTAGSGVVIFEYT